jgi:hypothetical protein
MLNTYCGFSKYFLKPGSQNGYARPPDNSYFLKGIFITQQGTDIGVFVK